MATAVGVYATPAGITQLINYTAAENGLIQTLCDRWNDWLEGQVGRILAPIPTFSSTVSSGGGAGSTQVTLASATGVAVGDALMFGPVSGTHEHGYVIAINGAVVTLQAALAATYANGTTVKRVHIFDGDNADATQRILPIPDGITYVNSLEIAATWGGIGSAWNLIPGTDYALRPTPLEREPGWPATELVLTSIPSSNNPYPFFSRYAASVRIDGGFGWPVAEDAIVGIACRLVVADYRRRSSGGGGTVSVGSDGSRVIELALTSQDWHTIRRYQQKSVDVI